MPKRQIKNTAPGARLALAAAAQVLLTLLLGFTFDPALTAVTVVAGLLGCGLVAWGVLAGGGP